MKILINLSKVWKFSKQISIKQKKVKIFTSFLFINFVIFSDLLIISILNYLITGEITSNQYISFLFNSFAAFYLIGLILIRFTFLFLDHLLRERLRLSLDKKLKFSSINKLLKKRNKEVSDVAYEVNNEATMLGLLYKNLVSFFTNTFQFLSFLLYIIYLDFSITVFLLIIGLTSSFLIFIQKKRNRTTSKNYQESLEEINLESVDIANNYYLIKILKIEDLVKENFEKTLKTFTDNFLKITNLRFVNYNTPQFIGTLSIALLIYFFNNSYSLEIIFLTLRMAQAYGASNESYHELTVKMPFLEKYLSRSIKENISDQGIHTINETLVDSIKAENVSFKYQDSDEYLFSGLTFNIKKNSHSVIVGKNGTGKSTLIGIIAGILSPSRGKVEISSQNIGYVGNKPYIFQSSLIENIRITKKLNKVEETEIDDLFKHLSFYENFPNNYLNKTVSKETLSDGQMQKLAFIRLILQKPEIIFLDEAFSNLDKESVNKIKKKIFANTTVINVTHKPEDFDNIDNKLLIENGNILFQK